MIYSVLNTLSFPLHSPGIRAAKWIKSPLATSNPINNDKKKEKILEINGSLHHLFDGSLFILSHRKM